MRVFSLAALAVGLAFAPAAFAASDLSLSDAKQVVKDLLAKTNKTDEHVGSAERQGSYIMVRTLTKENIPYHEFKVDPETGKIKGIPNNSMIGETWTARQKS